MKHLIAFILFSQLFTTGNAQDSCKAEMRTTIDEFTGEKTITTSMIDPISMIKVIKGKSVVYYLSLKSYGKTKVVDKKGAIVLFSDGTKFSKQTAEVDYEQGTGGERYIYTAFIELSSSEVAKFAEKHVTDIRLYIFDNEIGERNARELKCGTTQLLQIHK